MSEVKEGHQYKHMAEEPGKASNQGRKDNDSTTNEEDENEGCSPKMDSALTPEEKSPSSQVNVENHGDGKEKSPKNENPSTVKKPNSEKNEGETQSTDTNHDESCENTDNDASPKQQNAVTAATASSCGSANPDIKNGNNSTIQNNDSTEKEETDEKEGCSDKPMEAKSQPSQDDVRTHDDRRQESPKNKNPELKNELKSDKSHTTKQEAAQTTTSPIPEDEAGHKPALDEEISHTNDTNAAESGDEESTPSSSQLDEHGHAVETTGPTPPEAPQPAAPQVSGGQGILYSLLAVGMVVVVVAMLVQHFLQQESPPQRNDLRHIDVFLTQLEKVKTQFPNQRAELWSRSRIHLKRHLQTAKPTEPVSLILTAGFGAERTLKCLAEGLAFAFSSALNASFLYIDGASKAGQDSDQVKLDIDRKLQEGFDGDKPVAIIHRFEELPPGSTLIFYRYCDHENAAYKKTFLIFTVLLGEQEIPAKISLNAVEEMVDDHLQKKFLSHGQPVSFNMMDLDKYGGLWSRISHLILPVAAEEGIGPEGC